MANKHPNTKGLRPYPKGVSGNPGGRPKKRPITDEYYALADLEVPKEVCKKLRIKFVPGRTFSQWNAFSRWTDAIRREGHRASREIREAMEGKAPQRVEISTPEKSEITVRIIHDRKKQTSTE